MRIILIVLVFVLALLAAIYGKSFLENNFKLQPTIKDVKPQVNDPNTWKTYKNIKESYSIQYPPDYKIADSGEWITIFSDSNSVDSNTQAPYKTLYIYVAKELCLDISPSTYSKYNEEKVIESTISVDGIVAKKWMSTSYMFADPFFGDEIVQLDKNAKCYKFFYVTDPKNKVDSENLLEKMLNTFKVSDSGLTYLGNGYTFEYPSNLKLETASGAIFVGNHVTLTIQKGIGGCLGDCPTEKVTSSTEVTINGLKSTKKSGSTDVFRIAGYTPPQTFISYTFHHNGYSYEFRLDEIGRDSDGSTASESKYPADRTQQPLPNNEVKEFEQIVATFKFTNQ